MATRVPNLHDQISLALATEVGFECFFRGTSKYRWVLPRDSTDPRLRDAPSIPMPHDATQNPCYEISLDYEVYVTIDGDTLYLNNPHVGFNLHDPNLIDQLKAAFSNLRDLAERIKEATVNPKPLIIPFS